MAIDECDGDSSPTRGMVINVEEHFRSLKEGLSVKLSDLCERKDVLEGIIKTVDDANSWSVKTTEKLSEMVASKPDLQESKQQINEIEVNSNSRYCSISAC